MFYFLILVLLGPFYLLNLVLAIVSASYEMEMNECPEEVCLLISISKPHVYILLMDPYPDQYTLNYQITNNKNVRVS